MSDRTPTTVLDEYLVVQCQLGDADAFQTLVERWQARFLRYAYHFTQDREAARDVAQEAWLAVIRGLASLRDPGRFRAWAFRIVANKARDWVRRKQVRRRAGERARPDEESVVEPRTGFDTLGRIRAAMDELGDDHRLVLAWFYFEEMSVRQIAEALSIPAGTVKSRLYYARKALREHVEDRQDNQEDGK